MYDMSLIRSIIPYIKKDNALMYDNGDYVSLDNLVRITGVSKGKCWSIMQKLIKEHIIMKVESEKHTVYYVDVESLSSIPIPPSPIPKEHHEMKHKEPSHWRKEHGEYIRSRKWKNKRNAVLQRDKYKCKKCGSKKNLQVHHLTYEHFKHEPLEDLVTLCRNCHSKIHFKTIANFRINTPNL